MAVMVGTEDMVVIEVMEAMKAMAAIEGTVDLESISAQTPS